MRKRQVWNLLIFSLAFTAFALGMGAKAICQLIRIRILEKCFSLCLVVSVGLLILLVMDTLMSNRIWKGFRYFWNHWSIKDRLEKQMLDAGFGLQRCCFVELPKIKLVFEKDFTAGTLTIRNALKFDRKLDDVVMSAALGKFIVESHYQSDDGNMYIYELIDGSVSYKMTFKSFGDFKKYSGSTPTYKLFLDKRTVVKLQHCLLVGMTGSGKTYALYNLLLQMMNKDVPYQLFYADPKGSSLAVIGYAVAEERTAVDVEDIIKLLEKFVSLMRKRKEELRERLKEKIDADYSDFQMQPYVFICDEYASFAAKIATLDKKVRDGVKDMLYEVILQGRQLGFFLFLIMQKSDASLIDTALRDNIPLKIVLGNSEQQTYVTAFGAGVEIPNRHYLVGEGVFTEPELAPQPKLVQFPRLNFDILACAKTRTRVV